MSDRYDQNMILDYVEGELDDAQREAFETILAHDHELRNLVAQMKLDRQALRSLGARPAPTGLIEQVMQTQERAALLGDPEAPEPLPLAMPVNRHKLRRVLAYSGIAAVLLLSAALVVPTLMPSGLLNHKSPRTQDGLALNSGSGLTKADEDAAYDRNALVKQRQTVRHLTDDVLKQSASAEALVSDAHAEPSLQPALADAEVGTPDAQSAEADASRTLALAESDVTPDGMSPLADESFESTQSSRKVDAAVLADTQLQQPEASKTEAPSALVLSGKADPFTGYGGNAALIGQSQLLINTPSPTQARRDLRQWAMANSVRMVEEPVGKAVRDTESLAVEPSQLIVEIEQDQVPQLLAFLNRAPSQRAELVTLAHAEPGTNRAEASSNARRTQTPEASANTMVDTRAPWPQPSLATGLAPTRTQAQAGSRASNNQTRDKSQSLDAVEPSQPEPSESDQAPDTATGETAQAFDWNSIFRNITIQPVQPPAQAPTPLLQSEPTQRLRLQVMIRQVADEPATSESIAP